MKVTKLVSLLLTFVMVFTIAGCGAKKDEATNAPSNTQAPATQAPAADPTNAPVGGGADVVAPTSGGKYEIPADVIPSQTVTLTAFSQLANYSGEQVGWFAKVLLDKFNVKLNIVREGDGTFATRMADGNLGDLVILGHDGDEYLQAVNAGALFDWEEDNLLNDYGQYIRDNMQNALAKNRNLSGGKIYGFGHNVGTSTTDHESFFYYPAIRWDLYKELGYPEIKTLEDYIPVLEQMVALQPASDTGSKTYAVSLFSDWDGDMVMFVKSLAALYGYDEFALGLYDVANQTYEGCLDENGQYIRMLKWYNTLYQKGLLDPDSMTQTSDDMTEDNQTGAALFNQFSWMASAYNTPEHIDAGKQMLALPAKDFKNIAYGLNVNGGDRLWLIGAKTDYPELCMAIINWLATPEGTMVMANGPQGVTWDYDAAGNAYLTELGKAVKLDQNTELTDYAGPGKYSDGALQINNTTWSVDSTNPDSAKNEAYNYLFWDSYLAEQVVPPGEQDWRDYTKSLSVDQYLEDNGHISVAVGSTFSLATRSDELNTTWTQVTTAVKNGTWKAIYATSDAEFDQLVAQMITDAKAYGYDECIEWAKPEAARRAQLENEAKR
ncbi:hypothetical protein FACS189490_03130 [Clostridia bacterium]|nr:hypothetical protein FACS189490_03130 [Clostridia bacterium]